MLLNIKLNENFCLCETLQVLYVISAPISPIFSKQENTTFDLVSLAIVLCTCPLWASSLFERYCYDVLIVVCHKSSIDQLIFTHWKRLTQLSKHFFFLLLSRFPQPWEHMDQSFLDNNYARSYCGNSLVRPTVLSQFVSFHTKYFQSGRWVIIVKPLDLVPLQAW